MLVVGRVVAGGSMLRCFTAAALSGSAPVFQEAWLCELTGELVRCHAAYSHTLYTFAIDTFLVTGKLPQAA